MLIPHSLFDATFCQPAWHCWCSQEITLPQGETSTSPACQNSIETSSFPCMQIVSLIWWMIDWGTQDSQLGLFCIMWQMFQLFIVKYGELTHILLYFSSRRALFCPGSRLWGLHLLLLSGNSYGVQHNGKGKHRPYSSAIVLTLIRGDFLFTGRIRKCLRKLTGYGCIK